MDCKAEVSYFGGSSVNENICDFKVTMDDVFGGKIGESLEGVSNELSDFVLLEVFISFELGLKVALITKFGDDVAVSIACKNF